MKSDDALDGSATGHINKGEKHEEDALAGEAGSSPARRARGTRTLPGLFIPVRPRIVYETTSCWKRPPMAAKRSNLRGSPAPRIARSGPASGSPVAAAHALPSG